jgi:hypothetical protein
VRRPVTPCPKSLINARWENATIKCGDLAYMLADSRGIAAGTAASFEVKQTSDSAVVRTINGSAAASMRQAWTSQKTTDAWGGAERKFTVSSDGLTADSRDPQLSFHRYANIARAAYPAHITSGIYGWDRTALVELDDRVLKIHIPIKIRKCGDLPKQRKGEGYAAYVARWTPPTYNAAQHDLSAGEKTALKNAIEGFFRWQVCVHRTDCSRHLGPGGCPDPSTRKCCKFEIAVYVHFYNLNDAAAPASASTVNYWNGENRANSANWFMGHYPGSNWVFAHEVGHLLGFYDEYQPDGATGSAPWQASNGAGLMGGGRGIEKYYFDAYAAWLGDAARTNEEWAAEQYS